MSHSIDVTQGTYDSIKQRSKKSCRSDTLFTSPQNCPDISELSDFHLGNLPDKRLDAIASHLDQCVLCEQKLSAIEHTDDDVIRAVRGSKSGFSILRHEPSPDCLTSPGMRIGDYEILSEIGRGGMGLVLKARHVRLQRVVALKVLLAGEFAGSEYLVRFRAEAEATARLRHPGIVQIYEIGSWQNLSGTELPYLALEYIDGGSLSDRTQNRPQIPVSAARWVEQLALAVQHAHDQGVVHRDLKPSNILFTRDGQLKLCDFGVAKLLAGSDLQTRTGILVGTPEYMAPEQAAGESSDIGVAADIWALGAILYTLLTGRPPFIAADSLTLLQKVRFDEPLSPRKLQPSVTRDLETVCLKCLRKAPAQRYSSAQALADDLRRFCEGRTVVARPAGLIETGWRWLVRRPGTAAVLVLAVLMLTVGLPGVTWLWLRSETARHRAGELLEQAESSLYFNRIALARQGLETDGVEQARQMLAMCIPGPQQIDRRGWEWRYLNSQTHLGNRQGMKHESDLWSWIYDIAWHPAGTHLISVGGPVVENRDGQIRIWKLTTGECEVALDYPEGTVRATTWHPDGKRFVTGSSGGVVSIWEQQENSTEFVPRELLRCPKVQEGISCLEFTPDGRFLAAGTLLGLRLFDFENNTECFHLPLGWPGISSLEFRQENNPGDGPQTVLLISSEDVNSELHVREWSMSGSILNEIYHSCRPGPLAAASTGRGKSSGLLALSDPWRGVEIRDLSGSVLLERLRNHRGRVNDLEFSSDGLLATAGEDGTVRLWNTQDQLEFSVFRGHTDGVRKLEFSPDGKKLVSAGQDLSICIWDVDRDPRGLNVQGTESAWGEFAGGISFAEDSKSLMFICQFSRQAFRIDTLTGRRLNAQKLPLISRHDSARRDQSIAAFGRRLASPAPETPGIVNVLDPETGQTISRIHAHESTPLCVALSEDATVLATCFIKTVAEEHETEVSVWNASSGSRESNRTFKGVRASSLALNSDGRLLAVAMRNSNVTPSDELESSEVLITDPYSGQVLSVLKGCEGVITAIAFRPDSRQVAAVGLQSGFVYTWDLDQNHQPRQFLKRPALSSPTSVTYSHDGTRLAAGCYDNRVRLWDSATASEAITLLCTGPPGSGNYGFTSWVAFSPDGRKLAATDWHGCVSIWDAPPLIPRR